jgi:magnesium-transporting ATPase (P-type)
MGKDGTDVARDTADIVISDDNFSTIVAGVEEGRIAYDNIRKVIALLISCGAAEVLMVLLAFIMGMPLPLLPVQFLWLNLVTNGIQDVMLAFEPGDRETLKHPPRAPSEPIFNRLMIERTLVAALVMGLMCFGLFYSLMQKGIGEMEARNMVLCLMVLFQNVHIGNCRSETKSVFFISPLRNPWLVFGALSALGVHVLMTNIEFGHSVLHTKALPVDVWIDLFIMSLSVLFVVELHKVWIRKFRKFQY